MPNRANVTQFCMNQQCIYDNLLSFRNTCMVQFFFKENVRYLVWTCRDPIFCDSRDPMITLSDSRDPIFNSRDLNWVSKTT